MLSLLLALALAGDPQRISIDLQDADIHVVLKFLADYGGFNLVVDDSVQGKVTVRLKDVTWQDALAAVLASKGLGATTPTPGTMVIAPLR